jgi:hypothetical protein
MPMNKCGKLILLIAKVKMRHLAECYWLYKTLDKTIHIVILRSRLI